MQYLVLDDFIPQSLQNQLENTLLDNRTPWCYREVSGGVADNIDPQNKSIKESSQFVHNIYHYDENGVQSKAWDIAQIPMMFLEHHIKQTIEMPHRVRANLLLKDKDQEGFYHAPHVDIGNDNAFSMVYYVHDSDGDTVLFKERMKHGHMNLTECGRVSPKKGRAVIFPSNRYHASSSPVEASRRVIINFVFLAPETFLTKIG